jgi:hypothetical protein
MKRSESLIACTIDFGAPIQPTELEHPVMPLMADDHRPEACRA